MTDFRRELVERVTQQLQSLDWMRTPVGFFSDVLRIIRSQFDEPAASNPNDGTFGMPLCHQAPAQETGTEIDEYTKQPHRFRLWCAASHGHDLFEHDKGEFVTYEDYAALLKKLAAAPRAGEEEK